MRVRECVCVCICVCVCVEMGAGAWVHKSEHQVSHRVRRIPIHTSIGEAIKPFRCKYIYATSDATRVWDAPRALSCLCDECLANTRTRTRTHARTHTHHTGDLAMVPVLHDVQLRCARLLLHMLLFRHFVLQRLTVAERLRAQHEVVLCAPSGEGERWWRGGIVNG